MKMDAPIPGESLTKAPGNAPWERPPEVADPEQAIQGYLKRLSEPDRTEAILEFLELGADVKTLTEGILRDGVMNGIHSLDVSMIIAPVIHEFIKTSADAAGISYDEGFENVEEKQQQDEAIQKLRVNKRLTEMSGETPAPQAEPVIQDDAAMPSGESGGFMRPRGQGV